MSVFLVGCAGTERVDVTEGVRVTAAITDSSRMRYERFELLEDGTFKWGGGRAAMREDTSWETQLTGPSAQRLVTVMRSNGWIPGPPPKDEDSDPAEQDASSNERITVKGRYDGGGFKWTASTNVKSVQNVLGELAKVASQRDSGLVDRLSRPKLVR